MYRIALEKTVFWKYKIKSVGMYRCKRGDWMIKVKFVDFFNGYDMKNHFLYQALLRCGQEVSICDSPDYLICSVFGQI